MKTIVSLILLTALSALGQTNIITFTDANGVLYKDATAYKLGDNRLVYRTAEGGGTVELKTLPANIQQEFNYNSQAAQNADAMDAQRQADYQTARNAALQQQNITASQKLVGASPASNKAVEPTAQDQAQAMAQASAQAQAQSQQQARANDFSGGEQGSYLDQARSGHVQRGLHKVLMYHH